MPEAAPPVVRSDIAIVGAGPAGIAAAVAATGAGRRVCLIDANVRPGGQIWRHHVQAQLPSAARRWIARLNRPGLDLMLEASVVDAGPGTTLGITWRGAAVRLEADAIILATGAQELFLPFPGWTLPGVLGVGGAQALLKAGMDVRGKRVAVAGTGPLLLPVAASLARAGANLQLVAEQAPAARVREFAGSLWRSPGRLAQAAAYRAAFPLVRYRWGTWVKRVDPHAGALRVTYTDGRSTWAEIRDLLCTAAGLVPSTDLAELLGCRLESDAVAVDHLQATTVPGVYAVGEPTGNTGVDAALLEGTIAGLAAAGRGDAAGRHLTAREGHRAFSARVARAFALRPELLERAEAETILCRCEDVPCSAVEPGWSLREAKLARRVGMGACQGRICATALRRLRGIAPDTRRPPLTPVPVGVLADLAGSNRLSGGAS